ncbi:MAG: ABC transporter permease subunit [Candidatus Omnitrophica bacterium]|nr:ABC transporter permease subunit [Candidatus Omnitrophota bacterium]MBI2105028.1 ABC transporter permease subunit [Candidatus Omnitrophota bacterium]
MDLHIVRTILRHELREAQRNRWFVLCAAVFGVLALALSYLGLSGLGTFGVAGFGRTAASLLHLVMVIVPLMGLLMGALSVAGEREQGTLLTLLAQPVTPAEVLAGKFAGSAVALAGSLLVGFGASGAVVARYGGMSHAGSYAVLVIFTLLLGLMHLALGFCISVVTRRTSTALGLALGCWLAMVFLSDLGLMGTAMVLKLGPAELLWASLANPIQAFKLGALRAMHGTVDALGPSGRYAADVLGTHLAPLMAAWLAAWILVPMGVALRVFTRRGAV